MRYKNRELAEAFVHGTDPTNHTLAHNMHIFGSVLYSYGDHFPIAIRMTHDRYLINSDSYSQTTSMHQGHFARALGYDSFKDLAGSESNDFNLTTTKTLINLIRKAKANGIKYLNFEKTILDML